MILNSTKFGGNQTKHVEVGPDRQTGRFLYTPPNYVCGGYNENMALQDGGLSRGRQFSSILLSPCI